MPFFTRSVSPRPHSLSCVSCQPPAGWVVHEYMHNRGRHRRPGRGRSEKIKNPKSVEPQLASNPRRARKSRHSPIKVILTLRAGICAQRKKNRANNHALRLRVYNDGFGNASAFYFEAPLIPGFYLKSGVFKSPDLQCSQCPYRPEPSQHCSLFLGEHFLQRCPLMAHPVQPFQGLGGWKSNMRRLARKSITSLFIKRGQIPGMDLYEH